MWLCDWLPEPEGPFRTITLLILSLPFAWRVNQSLSSFILALSTTHCDWITISVLYRSEFFAISHQIFRFVFLCPNICIFRLIFRVFLSQSGHLVSILIWFRFGWRRCFSFRTRFYDRFRTFWDEWDVFKIEDVLIIAHFLYDKKWCDLVGKMNFAEFLVLLKCDAKPNLSWQHHIRQRHGRGQ